MNKDSWLTGPAMEGRHINSDGKDCGDLDFHLNGWNTDSKTQKTDLKQAIAREVELAECQALCLIGEKKRIAIEGLTRIYPEHDRRSIWEELLKGSK